MVFGLWFMVLGSRFETLFPRSVGQADIKTQIKLYIDRFQQHSYLHFKTTKVCSHDNFNIVEWKFCKKAFTNLFLFLFTKFFFKSFSFNILLFSKAFLFYPFFFLTMVFFFLSFLFSFFKLK